METMNYNEETEQCRISFDIWYRGKNRWIRYAKSFEGDIEAAKDYARSVAKSFSPTGGWRVIECNRHLAAEGEEIP